MRQANMPASRRSRSRSSRAEQPVARLSREVAVSYLDNIRLAFSGRFQADISTVNNDVRHFDNASFVPQYQEFQTNVDANGWFNPTGSGAFRLIDCRIVR